MSVDPSTPPTGRDPITGALSDEDEGELYVEVALPDGTVARWWRDTSVDGEVTIDDDTIDRLTSAIEAIIGSPDTILT